MTVNPKHERKLAPEAGFAIGIVGGLVLWAAIIATLLALCSDARGQTFRGVVPPCDPATYDHVLFRAPLNPPCATQQRYPTHVNDDGVVFEWGATVDFAAHSRNIAATGPQVGVVWVKVAGLWYLMPFYAPNPDGTTSGTPRPLLP